MKASGPANTFEEIDRYDAGVGWFAHPEEGMQRASHALAVDEEVWLVDPVDAPGVDELVSEFGTVSGVVVLLDRHKRDAAAIARRHEVPVYLPAALQSVASELDAETEGFRRELANTGYGAHEVVTNRFWREVALYGEDTGVLVVPEALGTAPHFCTETERLGVHPMLRLTPPRRLARLEPSRILVGHGEGIHSDPTSAIRTAVDGARKRTPRLFWKTLRSAMPS